MWANRDAPTATRQRRSGAAKLVDHAQPPGMATCLDGQRERRSILIQYRYIDVCGNPLLEVGSQAPVIRNGRFDAPAPQKSVHAWDRDRKRNLVEHPTDLGPYRSPAKQSIGKSIRRQKIAHPTMHIPGP